MTPINIALLVCLAAIWGSSFIFMRATVPEYGPIALIAMRIIIAAFCMSLFFLRKRRRVEFASHWKILLCIGIANSAVPFMLLAYASVSLSGGTVSILNAMTPIFTALIAHFVMNAKMNKIQFLGMFISIFGLVFLVWDKVSWSIDSWLPALAGIGAAMLYGIANNLSRKFLSDVSVITSSSGSLLFSAIFMGLLLPFNLPEYTQISSLSWLYGIVLGVICTALAYMIHFNLIKSIGPTMAATVTFLIPIFSFIWGYLLLGEEVTSRMLGATGIILFGMSMVMGMLKFKSKEPTLKIKPTNLQ